MELPPGRTKVTTRGRGRQDRIAPMDDFRRIAVVTGGNRGIGFETCRQLAKRGLKVVLGSRDEDRGSAAARRLRDEGLDVDPARLDVSDDASVREFADRVRRTYGRVDV